MTLELEFAVVVAVATGALPCVVEVAPPLPPGTVTDEAQFLNPIQELTSHTSNLVTLNTNGDWIDTGETVDAVNVIVELEPKSIYITNLH